VSIAAGERSDIRVDVTLVRVAFVATDTDGRPIHNLRPVELTVFEDGVPQDIKYHWTEVDLPLTVGLVSISAAARWAMCGLTALLSNGLSIV